MNDVEYTICRYELYPPEFHTAIAVGFLVKDISTGNTGTMEKLIPLEESNGKTQSEICNLVKIILPNKGIAFRLVDIASKAPSTNVIG